MFASKAATKAANYVLHGAKVGGSHVRHAPPRRQALHQIRCMSVWSKDLEPRGTLSSMPILQYPHAGGYYNQSNYSAYVSRGFATLADAEDEEEYVPQVVVEFHDDNDGTITTVTVGEGTKITEAATQAGVFIPTVSPSYLL